MYILIGLGLTFYAILGRYAYIKLNSKEHKEAMEYLDWVEEQLEQGRSLDEIYREQKQREENERIN
jgi:hypothetical protein